jgi:hypothetical protein
LNFLCELCVLCGEIHSSNFEFSGRREGCQWREKRNEYLTAESAEDAEKKIKEVSFLLVLQKAQSQGDGKKVLGILKN